jgi:hypothetical protein
MRWVPLLVLLPLGASGLARAGEDPGLTLALAREARRQGDLGRAEVLFVQALAARDDSPVRRELAALQIDRGGCRDAALTLQGIAEPERSLVDQDAIAACSELAPERRLGGLELRVYVDAISRGRAAERQGDLATARQVFTAGARAGSSRALWALVLDRVFEAGDCAAYRDLLSEVDLGTGALADARRARCGPPEASLGSGHGPLLPAPLGPTVTATRTDVPGWIVFGLGAALAVGCVALAGEYGTVVAEADDLGAQALDTDDPIQRAAIQGRASEVRAGADPLGVSALGMGIGAVLLVTTGIVLIAVDPGPSTPPVEVEGGLGWLGIRGRF